MIPTIEPGAIWRAEVRADKISLLKSHIILMKNSDVRPKAICPVLEEMASHFKTDTKQSNALEISAIAIIYIHRINQMTEFKAFVDSFNGDLTEESRDNLKSMGLE